MKNYSSFLVNIIFNWQVIIVYIYEVWHDVLVHVYNVEWLNQANYHIHHLAYPSFFFFVVRHLKLTLSNFGEIIVLFKKNSLTLQIFTEKTFHLAHGYEVPAYLYKQREFFSWIFSDRYPESTGRLWIQWCPLFQLWLQRTMLDSNSRFQPHICSSIHCFSRH